MSKPINISINPRIDTDPAKTYLIRVEGDKDQVFSLLDHSDEVGLDSYEIVSAPEGVDVGSREYKPIPGFYADIRYYDEPDSAPHRVFIAQTIDLGCKHPDDPDVFYYAGDFSEADIRKDYSFDLMEGGDWYIVSDNGCGCDQNPPCIGCGKSNPPAIEENRLHLFKVYTIAEDLTESDPVFVMARHEDGAACLFHKARARDCDNILCEVIVSKVQDAEVCDE